MKISALMTEYPVTVEMDDTLSIVKDIFDNTSFHHLLVVENKVLKGVLSDRDLFKSLSPNIDTEAATSKDLQCLNKKVHQIMSRQPIMLNDTASVKDAIELFNCHRISCIPIVSQDNKPVGIVSWRDIMQELGVRAANKQDAKQQELNSKKLA